MSRLLLSILLLLVCSILTAQTPWYRYFSIDNYGYSPVGECIVHELKQDLNTGDIWMLTDIPKNMKVYRLDSTGSNYTSWTHQTYGTIGSPTMNGDLVLGPNSSVIVSGWYHTLTAKTSKLTAYDTSGTQLWSHNFTDDYSVYIESICMNHTMDTLFVFMNGYSQKYGYDPTTGTLLDSVPFPDPEGDALALQNHDILMSGNGVIKRTDASGNVIWNVTVSAAYYDTNSVVVANLSGDVQKLDINTGSPIWSIPTTLTGISGMYITDNGGVLGVTANPSSAIQPHQMFYINAAGVLQWTRTYKAGYYGFNKVFQAIDGGILAGGTYFISEHSPWIQMTLYDQNNGYGSFIVHTDSAGNGPEQLSNTWTSDVNNDLIMDVTDGLFLGIAMNSTGPSRSSIGLGQTLPWALGKMYPSVDWGQTFANGEDYKHADCNGDGVVSPADASFIDPFSTTHPNWRGPQVVSSTGPPQCCASIISSADTVLAGQPFQVYITIGDSMSAPIDSIYVAHFNIQSNLSSFSNIIDTSQSSFTPYPGSFGVPGIETMTYNNGMPYLLMAGDEYYVTRLNQQNVTQFSDTIAVFDLVAGNVSSPADLMILLNSSQAMTYYEDLYDVTIGQGTVNVTILPITTDVSDKGGDVISIYPNPASHLLQLDHRGVTGTLRILNSLGQAVIKETLAVEKTELDVSHLPEGMYTLQLETQDGTIRNRKVSVIR